MCMVCPRYSSPAYTSVACPLVSPRSPHTAAAMGAWNVAPGKVDTLRRRRVAQHGYRCAVMMAALRHVLCVLGDAGPLPTLGRTRTAWCSCTSWASLGPRSRGDVESLGAICANREDGPRHQLQYRYVLSVGACGLFVPQQDHKWDEFQRELPSDILYDSFLWIPL
jgi:hypothetical protein